jgi:hypothetical protein
MSSDEDEEEEEEEDDEEATSPKKQGRKRHAKANDSNKGKRLRLSKDKVEKGRVDKKKPPKITTSSTRVRDVSKPAMNFIKDKFILGQYIFNKLHRYF